MYGHVINVPTHCNVKLPAIGGHLPNADADSHLLVSVPAITDSANTCRIFDYHLNPKSLAASCYIMMMHYFRFNNYSIHNYDNAHDIVFSMNIAGGN